ncbi:LssY C-terminal domain-containing protein [Herbiconiux daphne]|uniref:LssY C-terminal domain-containing protein n=1 Tax=Herbiconiux daphne TaxID=2970914 RepID=A0ABT2H5X0_9MICO|nr:LssY C-terminal domain-containing protein [Herbiconiux daphne]MCS5735304.1 LssY C-terminal domain-containing protein [Herbiconiux daphne]
MTEGNRAMAEHVSDESAQLSADDLEDASLVEHIRLRTFRGSVGLVVDSLFFFFGTLSAGWLAFLVATESFAKGWQQLWFLLVFWLVVAYLLLPRVHSILTLFYVPDYFIGRAKTREGLLGDPVNVALRGSEAQIHEAMTNAGWHLADDMGLTSALRTVRGTLLRRSYPGAPVSRLYLFGNLMNFTYQQEVAGNPSKRHHVRFWRCPTGWLLPGGHKADWLAAGTYDRSIGINFFTLQVTHRIDKETDKERDHIVTSLVESNELASVKLIRNFSTGYHHVNGGGDAIVTDGDLPVVDLRRVPTWDPADESRPHTIEPSVAPTPSAVFSESPIAGRRRPASIYLGVLLMALRVLSALAAVVVVAFSIGDGDIDLRNLTGALTPADSRFLASIVAALFVTVGLLIATVYSVLAFLIYHGHNWARFTGMSISAAAVVVTAIDFVNGGPQITLQTNLVGLSFDVLVLLALSGTDARKFSHRRALERREARQVRRAARRASTLSLR